jgi:formimidoylglutamate deiminase
VARLPDPVDLRGRALWAELAWLPGGWQRDVRLEVGPDGRWSAVASGVPAGPDALRLDGPALPGLVDAHSHAFQRAFAGLAERRDPGAPRDDFWSWREAMYRIARRIGPQALRAVAAQLDLELLRGGYTRVCEFHYLHGPAEEGGAGAGTAAAAAAGDAQAGLSAALALADAAFEAGIGLVLLPALYERAGFDRPGLRPEQRRFASGVESVCALRDALRAAGRPGLNVGLAIHSLRAASEASIRRLLERLDDAPLHVHVAEQLGEVEDCLAATGRRPIEWLAATLPLDARWQLVHATHATPAEIEAVARSGAGVVLCPGTEADLGDGLPDLPRWLEAGVPLALGSDSQVTRDWPGELRCLEWGQRLALRRRNVAASAREPSTAARLFERVLAGGAAAAGEPHWGLVAGAPADLLVLDPDEPVLRGVAPARRLDVLVFATAARPFRDVLVGGRWSLRGHRHAAEAAIAARFAAALQELAAGDA